MPQNMKSSDRFRTVSDSAVLCQLIPPPYMYQFEKFGDYEIMVYNESLGVSLTKYLHGAKNYSIK